MGSIPVQGTKIPHALWCGQEIKTGFPGGSDGKESACNVGDPDLIPGLGRSPGEGNGNPLHYSCLRTPMDRGASWATVHGGHKELDMTERLTLINLLPPTPIHGQR